MSNPMEKLLDAIEWREIPTEEMDKEPTDGTPYATHEGTLDVMGYQFRCYQLSTGVRVLDAEDVEKFFGDGGAVAFYPAGGGIR